MIFGHACGWKCWSVSWSTTLIQTEISRKLLNELPWNLVKLCMEKNLKEFFRFYIPFQHFHQFLSVGSIAYCTVRECGILGVTAANKLLYNIKTHFILFTQGFYQLSLFSLVEIEFVTFHSQQNFCRNSLCCLSVIEESSLSRFSFYSVANVWSYLIFFLYKCCSLLLFRWTFHLNFVMQPLFHR